jgi:hypothetical protein
VGGFSVYFFPLHTLRSMFRIIQDLVSELLVDVGALYKASEAVRMFK